MFIQFVNIFPLHFTDVTIRFEENSYSISEGNEVDVCQLLVGETDIEIPVVLSIEDVTTNSESSPPKIILKCIHICGSSVSLVDAIDYITETLQLSLNASNTESRVCTTISALDDTTLESGEQLSFFLSTTATHSSEPAIVTLIDNDGKLYN